MSYRNAPDYTSWFIPRQENVLLGIYNPAELLYNMVQELSMSISIQRMAKSTTVDV